MDEIKIVKTDKLSLAVQIVAAMAALGNAIFMLKNGYPITEFLGWLLFIIVLFVNVRFDAR